MGLLVSQACWYPGIHIQAFNGADSIPWNVIWNVIRGIEMSAV
jgi:hypothetical protein